MISQEVIIDDRIEVVQAGRHVAIPQRHDELEAIGCAPDP
jgi:hypothetical protein